MNARTLSKPRSACSAGTSGCSADERRVGGVDDGELEPEALGIVEPEPARRCGRVAIPSAPSRASQKSSVSSEPTRNEIVCTIPAPARPRRAPGYSKKVMSAPGLPASSA